MEPRSVIRAATRRDGRRAEEIAVAMAKLLGSEIKQQS
jgi:hypothetical protein